MHPISPYFQLPREESMVTWTAVLRRSAIDPGYRERLLADPRAAIREETGIELPAGYNVRFAEKPEGVHDLIVLPNPIPEAAEVSEEQLEAVAGGCDCSLTACGCSACSATEGGDDPALIGASSVS